MAYFAYPPWETHLLRFKIWLSLVESMKTMCSRKKFLLLSLFVFSAAHAQKSDPKISVRDPFIYEYVTRTKQQADRFGSAVSIFRSPLEVEKFCKGKTPEACYLGVLRNVYTKYPRTTLNGSMILTVGCASVGVKRGQSPAGKLMSFKFLVECLTLNAENWLKYGERDRAAVYQKLSDSSVSATDRAVLEEILKVEMVQMAKILIGQEKNPQIRWKLSLEEYTAGFKILLSKSEDKLSETDRADCRRVLATAIKVLKQF